MLAVVHIAAVCICFGAAILRPERSALAPIVIWVADMPASLVIEPIRHALHALTAGYTSRLLIDASVYALLGTVWWILVGMVIAWIIGGWRASLRDGTTI